jgi:para-nitrobenzyl esterase
MNVLRAGLRLFFFAALAMACGGSLPATSSADGSADATSPSRVSADGIAATEQGLVRGARDGGTWAFKGIPYAAAPTGALRFRPPDSPRAWSGILAATQFGATCPQRDRKTGEVAGNEDCLTVNVWTPASTPVDPLPVLVFVHGGAFVAGASSLPVYDGRRLAELGNVVVVTLNYRLGPLGFMAHPALTAESEHHASGNYGLLDQTAALRWVQANVRAFGGDRSRVLLFGQSAGAIGLCAHLASELSRGLFSRAMMLSGGCNAWPLAQAEEGGRNVARRLGCEAAADVAACLRGAPVDAVVAAPVNDGRSDSGRVGPTVDGWFLRDVPGNRVGTPGFDGVPVIVSTTRDEFANQLGLYGGTHAVASEAEYEALVRQMYPARADEMLRLYPSSSYRSPNGALIALLGDSFFICPSRSAARQLSRGTTPVWRAEFDHPFHGGPLDGLAPHGIDLMFGFGNLTIGGYAPSPDEQALADALGATWARFAATGDPGGSWPRYEAARDDYLAIETPLHTGAGIHSALCDAWSR